MKAKLSKAPQTFYFDWSDLPPHSLLSAEFDMFIASTFEGPEDGQEILQLTADGQVVFSLPATIMEPRTKGRWGTWCSTLATKGSLGPQPYPVQAQYLGFCNIDEGRFSDSYRVTVTFPHASSDVSIGACSDELFFADNYFVDVPTASGAAVWTSEIGTEFHYLSMQATFSIDARKKRIDPAADGLTIRLDHNVIEIPAHLFWPEPLGNYLFEGSVGITRLEGRLRPFGAGRYCLSLSASGLSLTGLSNHLVKLAIGNDGGVAAVTFSKLHDQVTVSVGPVSCSGGFGCN